MEKSLKVIKGFIFALMVFLISSAVFALLLKFTGLPEKFALIYILASFSLATLVFGIFIGNLTMKGGLLYGGASAIVFIFMIYYAITTLCMLPLEIGLDDLRFLIPVAFGCLGGMVGVNLKN